MSKFKIALVNHADHAIPEHWDTETSIRRTRAIRKARKLRAEGNKFVILFELWANGEWVPISLKSLGDPSHFISKGKPPKNKTHTKRTERMAPQLEPDTAALLEIARIFNGLDA